MEREGSTLSTLNIVSIYLRPSMHLFPSAGDQTLLLLRVLSGHFRLPSPSTRSNHYHYASSLPSGGDGRAGGGKGRSLSLPSPKERTPSER